MKSMTCNELGGACGKVFRAETFEEIAEMSKNHGMEMFQTGDDAHLKAMEDMKKLMSDSAAMQAWFARRKREFEELPEDPE